MLVFYCSALVLFVVEEEAPVVVVDVLRGRQLDSHHEGTTGRYYLRAALKE